GRRTATRIGICCRHSQAGYRNSIWREKLAVLLEAEILETGLSDYDPHHSVVGSCGGSVCWRGAPVPAVWVQRRCSRLEGVERSCRDDAPHLGGRLNLPRRTRFPDGFGKR